MVFRSQWWGEDDVSKLSGWYPQPDGPQRYWDGELWSDFAPVNRPSRTRRAAARAGMRVRHPGRATAALGWGALVLAALIGALSPRYSGAAVMSGLLALVAGVTALVHDRRRSKG